MARRFSRSETPPNAGAVVRALRLCRDALIRDVFMTTVPFGPTYRLALVASRALGKLADHLSGEPGYFDATGSAHDPSHRQRLDKRLAWERGEGDRPQPSPAATDAAADR